ncbi:hypothetical protein Halhy_2360 [Haliscomenobacter hydrossis DSM 1100]|uniref:Uncharacterized protein n=1 Tax=Haliscomenobacter hydrossis (strain ATCC 27775 / DSM 1100 / LMG 10767 / O) TaxID=760192 RepID=F4KVB0_HALH1|nr:hypothetical protein Halhy_2360 [Haliscomenobacter hydrossis DSM 1100]
MVSGYDIRHPNCGKKSILWSRNLNVAANIVRLKPLQLDGIVVLEVFVQ